MRRGLLAAVVIAALGAAPVANAQVTIVLDPGHNRYPNLSLEPIGPGSSQLKIMDGGGTHGVVTGQSEASVVLRIAFRLRTLLRADGLHVIMTRHKTCCISKGNRARARIANRAHAALFLRIHADGSTDHAVRGTSMLYPALHTGWTDDIYRRSRQAARIVQSRLVRAARLARPRPGRARRSHGLQLGQRAGHPHRGGLPHEPLGGSRARDPRDRQARGAGVGGRCAPLPPGPRLALTYGPTGL